MKRIFILMLCVLFFASLFMAGCKTTKKKKKDGYNFGHLKPVKTVRHPMEKEMVKGHKFTQEKSPLAELKVKKPVIRKKTKIQPFYMKHIKKGGDGDKATKVTINFSGAKLSDVVPAFAQILKFNYSIDPMCNGTVTMSIDAELTPKELWKIFEQMLWMSGTYCSSSGELIRILPHSKMSMQQQIGFGKDPVSQENVELLFYPLQYADAKKIVEQLKPFTHKGRMQ